MKMLHKHHIVPRHMGGTDDCSNIVELTIEEHAEAHRILFAEHGKLEDKIAWLSLSKQIDHDTIMLERAKLGGSKGKNNPKKMGANNSFYGKTHSYETKKKIGEKSRGRNVGKLAWNSGIKGVFHHTEEVKERIRNSKLGKKRIGFIPWNKRK